MTEQEIKIADLQRLCQRAHHILSENWDNYTDSDGYGPLNLLHDLEKVINGKECKDLQIINSELRRICKEQAGTIKELELRLDNKI